MPKFELLINGELVTGDAKMDVVNPATEEVFAQCSRASEAQLNATVSAARAAFQKWQKTGIQERRVLLAKVADILEANATELASILTQEQGKPLQSARSEIQSTADFFRYFANLDLPVEVLEDSAERRVEAHRTPLGVVAAIVPWNVPMVLMAFKVPAALLAGNTIIVKPAPTTPLTTLRFGELIKDVFPPGVINIITDGNDLGPLLTTHPDIAKISFTGSTETGSRVMAGAARQIKRLTLELGGNDAGIILDDVDSTTIAPKVYAAAFGNSGQICIAIKRLYVHESKYDEFVEELAKVNSNTVVGNGLEADTTMGPLQNKAQFEKVKELLADAKLHGTVVTGGIIPDGPGYFIAPTIFRDIDEDSRLVREEQFGPLLPVLKFSDEEEAIERANDCDYGLGGSIWSSDLARAKRLAEKLEAGTVWINQHTGLDKRYPFAGMKRSGFGTELGQAGLEEFTQRKIISIPSGFA